MSKTYIFEGDKIPTGDGYLEIVSRHYNIGAYCNEYELDDDGNYICVGNGLFAKQDICSKWKEHDGRNHDIIIEKAKYLYTISSPSGPIDKVEAEEGFTIEQYLEECEINGCEYENPEELTIDDGEQIVKDYT